MANLFKLIVVLCSVLFFQSAFASSVSDIDELISMYDSSKCKECHDDITPSWIHSSHSRSVINPETIKAVNATIAKSAMTDKRAAIKTCLSCHAPQVSSASESLIDHIADLINFTPCGLCRSSLFPFLFQL